MSRILFAGLAPLALLACNATQEIDDPAMAATGATVGAETAALAQLPDDADESQVQSQVSVIGGHLQSLSTQHQSFAAANGFGVDAPGVDRDLAEQDGGSGVSWDGTHLVIDHTWEEDGNSYDYRVDLTFGESADGGVTIDGSYFYAFDIAGYSWKIDADYDGLVSDGVGCVVSGVLTVKYDMDFTALNGIPLPGLQSADAKGTIVVTFNGCSDVTVEGTK